MLKSSIRPFTVSSRMLGLSSQLRSFSYSSSLLQKDDSKPDIITQLEHNEIPKEVVSGSPKELITERVVRIYKESKPATQSGKWGGHDWKLDWDILGKGNRWENDLIGFQSSSDYMQGTIMKFDTKEAAVKFAQGQGWSFYVQEPKERHFKIKDYSKNFFHSPTKLKHIRTK